MLFGTTTLFHLFFYVYGELEILVVFSMRVCFLLFNNVISYLQRLHTTNTD